MHTLLLRLKNTNACYPHYIITIYIVYTIYTLPMLQAGPELQRAEHHSGGLGEVERGRGPGRRAHGGHRARHHAEEVPPTHQVNIP